MLRFNFFSWEIFRAFQCGFYVDFLFKKIIEIFIRNYLIYSSIFFAEKYLIEFFTKKLIEYSFFNLSKIFGFLNLTYFHYFIQLISFFFIF